MSDLITDEMADAFNKVMRDRAAIYGKPAEPGPIIEDTKAALEAVLPFIFSETDIWLNRIKADAWDSGFDVGAACGISYQAGNNDALISRNPYREKDQT